MSQKKRQRETTSRRREEARERLLEAAEAQLREQEFDLFSIDKVVERAGESVGTFYRIFSGKQSLLHAVHDRLHKRMQPVILEALEAEEHTLHTLEEAVDHTFGVMIDRMLQERRVYRAFMMLSAFDADTRQKFREANLERRDAVVAVLNKHRAEIAHPDPHQAIHQAYHMYLSTMHGRLVFYGPGMSPIRGVSDEILFSQLKLSICNFLVGNNSGSPEST